MEEKSSNQIKDTKKMKIKKTKWKKRNLEMAMNWVLEQTLRRAATVMASCGRDGEQQQQRGRDGGMTEFFGVFKGKWWT